jgi:putative spermidine/putrescine transport system substrate-binding protein
MRKAVPFLVTLALLAAACAGGDGGQQGGKVTLTFVSFGGAYQEAQTKAWLEPYVKAHPNVRIVQDEPTDYAKLESMVKTANVTWDVVDVGPEFGLGEQAELLEPIDCNVVPCSQLRPDEFPQGDPPIRVPDIIWSIGVSYNQQLTQGRDPQDWQDFFNLEKFPGKRAVWKFPFSGILEGALIADGVPPDQLYPLDVDRAFRKLNTIKDQIIWWDAGQQCAQFVGDGEAVMGNCWNGRVFDVKQQGDPVAFQWNQAIHVADYLVVPKGSPDKDEAMKLISWIVSKGHIADLSHFIPYAPPNPQAEGQVDPDMKPWLPTTHQRNAVLFDDQWWGENFDQLNQRFLEWLQE